MYRILPETIERVIDGLWLAAEVISRRFIKKWTDARIYSRQDMALAILSCLPLYLNTSAFRIDDIQPKSVCLLLLNTPALNVLLRKLAECHPSKCTLITKCVSTVCIKDKCTFKESFVCVCVGGGTLHVLLVACNPTFSATLFVHCEIISLSTGYSAEKGG